MNKIFASAAAAFVTVAVMASAPAMADNNTINVKGTVASVCTVSVQDMGQSLNLVQGANNVVVGKVTETCNSANGYTISVASSNGGKLVNGNAKVDYTVNFDGQQNQTLNSALQVRHNDQVYGDTKDLQVNVAGNANRVAGNYADTLTITIASN